MDQTPENLSHTTVVLYRLDLRLDDHPPLTYAASRGRVVPVYIGADGNSGSARPTGGASKWWLHHALGSLADALDKLGSPLVLRQGNPAQELEALCKAVGADQVAIHESIDPAQQPLDDQLDDQLARSNIELVRFEPSLLWPIGSVLTGSAQPYKVFTPFWNRAKSTPVEPPIERPRAIHPPEHTPDSLPIEALGLLDDVDWAAGLRARWNPGEPNAISALDDFVQHRIDQYHESRDQLFHDQQAKPAWSALSAPIHFGELSVRRIWHTIQSRCKNAIEHNPGPLAYARQLAWHDFAAHLLNHFPHTCDQPFRKEFKRFPWATNPDHLARWQTGRTGYPIVDAAMRQLWHEGTMPNRARMIVASFLCKHLLISWKEGEAWFWNTLVDADLANNTFGWQWVAGCGADAAPYFRIFNPITQGKKFDPQGSYVRRWVPELADLPDTLIHTPWLAPPLARQASGITLGETYPFPIVDHKDARAKALDAFATLKN